MLTRRTALSGAVRGLAAVAGANLLQIRAAWSAVEDHVVHTDAEWRKLLTPAQYAVLRKDGTEPPFTSPLLHEERRGTFACAGCGLDLFSSSTKFDSGTGWPSFWAPLDNAVNTKEDRSFGMTPHRGDVPALRWTSRPCFRRRTEADRASLLHERRRADFQASPRLRRRNPVVRSPWVSSGVGP